MAGITSDKEKLKKQLEELEKKMALKTRKLAEIKQKVQGQSFMKLSDHGSMRNKIHLDLNRNHMDDPIIQAAPVSCGINNAKHDKTINRDQTSIAVKSGSNLGDQISKKCKSWPSGPTSVDNVTQSKANNMSNCIVDKKSPRVSSMETVDVDFEDDIFQDNMTCIFANIASQDCATVPSTLPCNVNPTMKQQGKIDHMGTARVHKKNFTIPSDKIVHGKSNKRSADSLFEDSLAKSCKKTTFEKPLPKACFEVIVDVTENKVQKKLQLDPSVEANSLDNHEKSADPMFCGIIKNDLKGYDNLPSEDLSLHEDMFASQFQFSELQNSESKDFSKLELNEMSNVKPKKTKEEEEEEDNLNFIKTPAFIPLSKIAAKLEVESKDSAENSGTIVNDSKFERTENVFDNFETKILSSTFGFQEQETNPDIKDVHNGEYLNHDFTPNSSLPCIDDFKRHIFEHKKNTKDLTLGCTADVKSDDSEESNSMSYAQFKDAYLSSTISHHDEKAEFGEDAFLKTKNGFQIVQLDQPASAFESESNDRKLETPYKHSLTDSQIFDYDQDHFDHDQDHFDPDKLPSELEVEKQFLFKLQDETAQKENGDDKVLPEKLSARILESTKVKEKSSPRKKVFPVSARRPPCNKKEDTRYKSKDLSDDDDDDDAPPPESYRYTEDRFCKECVQNGIIKETSDASTSRGNQSCSSIVLEDDAQPFLNMAIMEDVIQRFATDMSTSAVPRRYGDGTSSCFDYEINDQHNDETYFQQPHFRFFLCRELEPTTLAVEKISISVYRKRAQVFCVFGQFVTVYERFQEHDDTWTPFYHHDFGDGITVKACLSLNDFVNMIFITVLSSDDGLALKFFNFTEDCAAPVPVLHNNFMEQRNKTDKIFMSKLHQLNFVVMAVSETDSLVCAYELYDIPDEEKGREFYFVFKNDYENAIPCTSIASVQNESNSVLLLGENQLVLWNFEQGDISYCFDMPEDIRIPGSVMDYAYSEDENLFVLFSFEDTFHHRMCRLMMFNFTKMNCRIVHNYNHYVAEAVVKDEVHSATMTAVDIVNGLIFVICHGHCNIFDLMTGIQIKSPSCSDVITAIACGYSILFLGLQRGGGQALYYTKGHQN